MKNKVIAYLIQAHNNADHLYRLVKKLNNTEVCFFIHIDKKTSLLKFKKKLINFENVFFLEERFSVTWKGFSQVEATLALIKKSLKNKYKFKYFILLSGVDFPIKSNNEILNFFRNNTSNYIEYSKINESRSYIEYFKNSQLWFKISKWHFYDDIGINFNSKNNSIKHNMYRCFILFNILILNNILKNKNIKKDISYYFGSSWWCLNLKSIVHIHNTSKSDKKFNHTLRYSDAPDEMFFQTILLNSSYKEECINDNLRYIDWDTNREGPAILDENDFEKIQASKSLFTRKIGKRSSKLLDKLEENI